jgi:hypothetical protein
MLITVFHLKKYDLALALLKVSKENSWFVVHSKIKDNLLCFLTDIEQRVTNRFYIFD